MANKDGIITRKDMFSDDALNFGRDYAEQIELAIESNEALVKSAKDLHKVASSMKSVTLNSEYLKLKQAETLATQEATNAIKLKEAAEISALKIRQQQIQTSEIERKANEAKAASIEKENRTKEKSIKLSLEERIIQQHINKLQRQSIMDKLGMTSAYDKLNRERTRAKNTLRDLIATEGASAKQIKAAQKEFEILDKKVRAADKAVGDFSKNVGNYPQIAKLTNLLSGLVAAFGIQVGIQIFTNALKYAWSVIVEFDSAMTELSAVTRESKSELKGLKNEILDVSKRSVNSAVDVAKLAVELSKLGATTPQIKQMIGTVDMFSVAMEASAEESAQFLLGVMNSFGAASTESERYGNVMANAANISALGFQELQDSLKYVAPVANAANISLERVTAMVGLLVDNNLEASQSGTALRSILLTLAKQGMSYEEAMSKINSSTDKLATATKLFGKESSTAALILANNVQKLDEYEQKLMDSENALKGLNETKMTSLENQIKQVSSAWDGFILSIESGDGVISKFFTKATQGLTSFLNMLSNANKGFKDLMEDAGTSAQKSTAEMIDSNVRQSALLAKINEQARKYGATSLEIFNKSGNAYKKAEAEMTSYYSTNKTELEKLVKAEQERYKQSSLYTTGTKVAKKNLDEVSESIKKQIELVEKLNADDENNSTRRLNKAAFGIDSISPELKNARQELERLMILQKQHQATLQAYEEYGTESAIIAPVVEDDSTDSEKALKAREKARSEYLKRIQQLAKEEYDLNLWRLSNERDILEEIANDEEEFINNRLDAYHDAQAIELEIVRLTAAQKLKEYSRYDDNIRDLTDDQIKILTEGSQQEIDVLMNSLSEKNKLTDAEILIIDQLQSQRDKIAKRQEKNVQKIYDAEVKLAEKAIENQRRKISIEEDRELAKEYDSFKALVNSNKLTEKEVEEHEYRLLKIKEKYAKQGLESQLEEYKKLIDSSNISADERAKAEEKYYSIKRQLAETDISDSLRNKLKLIEQEKLYNQMMEDLAFQLHTALADFVNVLFENKISKYDQELSELESYYNQQFEYAADDQAQRELLEAEAERKREEIEAKKRKEQTRQAIFNKAIRVMEIGSATALAIMQAYAQLGVFATPAAIMIGAVGAVQTAAVVAQKIPKYKKGRKGGPAEVAEVGDGYVHEVVEKKSGFAFMTPNKPTLTYLEEGDKVHSSVESYLKSQRESLLSDTQVQGQRVYDFQKNSRNNNLDKEILDELKRNTSEIAKSNRRQPKLNNTDIPHSIWKYKNLNWN